MQDGQVGIEYEGALKRALGLDGTDRVVEILPQHPLAAAESRPGRRELRIEGHALLINVARLGDVIPVSSQLVATQIELVDARGPWHVGPDHAARGLAQRPRQRADDPGHQLVLHRQHVCQRMLRRVRPDDGAGRRFDQLRRRAKLAAGAENGADERNVHVGVGGELAQVRRLRVEARCRRAGAHQQVGSAGQRHRDCVGQAEGQEIGFGVRAQHAKRQRDESGHRPRRHRRELSRIAIRDGFANCGGHRDCRVVAIGGLLLQRLVDHAVEPGHRAPAGQGRRLLVQDGVEHVDHRGAGERHLARQHLEEHRRQREEIGARVEHFPAHLLRRHVVRCPDDGAGLGETSRAVGTEAAGDRPGQAEVEQLHAVRRQEQVRRLQVAMDHPARVQRIEGVENLQGDGGGIGRRERPARHARAERFAGQELHRQDQPAVGFLDLVELADVGMRDAGGGPGLAPHPFARRVVGLAANRLQRNRAVKPLVAGRVDDSHATFTDLPFDLVATDPIGNRRRCGGHRDRL